MKKLTTYMKFLLRFYNQRNQGYTLIEITGVLVMMGILTAVAAPNISHNNQLEDAISLTEQVLKVAQSRAIATTSAIRIRVDSVSSPQKLIVENSTTRGCEATTQLSAAVSSTDTDLTVFSTDGFVVGDNLKIGSDSTDNTVLAIDSANSIITLGTNIDTSQTVNTDVELANNWSSDVSLQADDLTLPEDVQITANVTDWKLCFNSRGIAYLYDASGIVNNNLVLTIGGNDTLTILKGGAIVRN